MALRRYRLEGYRLLKRNWHIVGTEVDLVFETPDRGGVVLVEVRGRRLGDLGFRPRDTLSFAKRARLFRAVQAAERINFGFEPRTVRLELCEIIERSKAGWFAPPAEIFTYPLDM